MKRINLKLIVFTILLSVLVTFCTSKKNEENSSFTLEQEFINEHNSENSLDWHGVYEGLLPCADCEGIKTLITLNEDNTFTILEIYLKQQKEYISEHSGMIEWDKTGSIINLKSEEEKRMYFVGENQLFHLDVNGEKIKGALEDMYILKKVD